MFEQIFITRKCQTKQFSFKKLTSTSFLYPGGGAGTHVNSETITASRYEDMIGVGA